MADRGKISERLRRALAYPYAIPDHSFVQLGERTLELRADDFNPSGREPLLAYGSNAAPEALARKLAPEPSTPLPLIRAELSGFDAVYSAHVSPYGAVPATLQRSPGTVLDVFVAYPTDAQRRLLVATEPNYELHRLAAISCNPQLGAAPEELDVFLSRHGCLLPDGSEVALAAIGARGRKFREMGEPEVLEWVRSAVCPELSLEQFVADPARAQTAAKRLRAKRAINP